MRQWPRCLVIYPRVWHSLGPMLVMAAVAVAAGCSLDPGDLGMGCDAPQWVLGALRSRWDPRRGRYIAPNEAALRRVLGLVDGDLLDTVVSAWTQDRCGPLVAPSGRSAVGGHRTGWQVAARNICPPLGTVYRGWGRG